MDAHKDKLASSETKPMAADAAGAPGTVVNAVRHREARPNKQAMIAGRKIDLYVTASSYRTLMLGIGLGLAAILVRVLLPAGRSGGFIGWLLAPGWFSLLFWPVQIAAAVTMGIGTGQACSAIGELDDAVDDDGLKAAVLGMIPILGMLPAARTIGKLHRILNSVGVPLGILGPSRHTLDGLRHGICHECGYDLTLLLAGRCPECNADVTGDKSEGAALRTPLEVDPSVAWAMAVKCRLTALAGIGLGFVQIALCVTPVSELPNPWLVVFVVPGLVFGGVAGKVSFAARKVLREAGTADFVAVGIASLALPPVAGVLLLRQAGRLDFAATRARAAAFATRRTGNPAGPGQG